MEALKRHYGVESFKVEKEIPFRALIHCILSQRIRDVNASKAARALFAVASTPQAILILSPETLRKIIKPSGYYNLKAKYIFNACKEIVERFGGETPSTRADLLRLPGVGPKTADIVLSYGYGQPAIAVDTHIQRVSSRIGLVKEGAKPQEVKKVLESSISQRDWTYVDGALLKIGKDYCSSRKPDCRSCPLRDLCKKRRRSSGGQHDHPQVRCRNRRGGRTRPQ